MTRSHDSRYMPPADPYATHRCECGHLLYIGDPPGDNCRYCPCTDHRPANEAGGS